MENIVSLAFVWYNFLTMPTQIDWSTLRFTFPQAFALCLWRQSMPEKTDGMVRVALQRKNLVDSDKLLTSLGAELVGAVQTLASDAFTVEDLEGTDLVIRKTDSPLRRCAANLLVMAGFAQWGDSLPDEGRGLGMTQLSRKHFVSLAPHIPEGKEGPGPEGLITLVHK